MKTAGIITLIALIVCTISMYVGVVMIIRESNKKYGHKHKSQNKYNKQKQK